MTRPWPWSRQPAPAPAPIPDRIRNEIQQLVSIRDDALRVTPGSPLHQWLNGAIFALLWALTPYQAQPPSAPAARMRSGIEAKWPP